MGLGVSSLLAAVAAAAPIPDPVPTTLPHYQGAPAEGRLVVLAVSRDGRSIRKVRDYDLGRGRISSALPDFKGRIWFVTRRRGEVGILNPRTGATAYKVYAGSGLAFNNNDAGLALGRDGTAYLGVIGAIVA